MEIDGQWKNIILELETLKKIFEDQFQWINHVISWKSSNTTYFRIVFLFKSKIWQFLGSPLGPLGRPENLDLSIWLPPFFPVLFRDPIVPPISGNAVIKILYVWMYVCLSLYMMFLQTSWKHECVEPQIRCRQLKPECLFDDCRFFFKM